MNSRNRQCALTGRPSRMLISMIGVAPMIPVLVSGCQESAATTNQGPGQSIRVSNDWLQKNVQIKIDRAEVNGESGLFEVDASIVASALEKNRRASYRIVCRTEYYADSGKEPVDVSEWSELTLQPGSRLSYQSASLTRADDFVIELAYPEEVGLE